MPTFEYQAHTAEGQAVRGTLFAISLDQALRDLSGKGMQVQNIGLAVVPGDPLSFAGNGVPANSVSPVRTRVPAGTVIAGTNPTDSGGPSGDYERGLAPGPQEIPRHEVPGNGYRPTSYVEEGPSTQQRSYMATSVWGPLVGQVPLTALSFFFRQGSTMFEAGVPMVQALETLSGQSQSPKFKGIVKEIVGHVKAGRPMSVGMQRYPEVFSPIVISLVRSGEEGGFLSDAMGSVADYLEREIELRNLYKRVTFMPKLQVVISIIIIIGANAIIDSLGGKEKLSSPLTTASTWYWLTPLIVATFLFVKVGLANPTIKYGWDTFMSFVPYIGNTMRQLAMAKFGRAFGALYKGGVPVQKSLLMAADACGNEFLRARMYTAGGKLEAGEGIGETFRSTHAFSPIVLDMVSTGETTGNVDLMINKMAEYYEDEAATRSVKTGQMTGVLLGLLVAIYIGYIIINFWSGHYSSQNLGG